MPSHTSKFPPVSIYTWIKASMWMFSCWVTNISCILCYTHEICCLFAFVSELDAEEGIHYFSFISTAWVSFNLACHLVDLEISMCFVLYYSLSYFDVVFISLLDKHLYIAQVVHQYQVLKMQLLCFCHEATHTCTWNIYICCKFTCLSSE